MQDAPPNTSSSSFLPDGYSRMMAAIEAEVRAEVEAEYAEQWNRSSYVRRWFLAGKINREVRQRLCERLENSRPDAPC